MDPLAIYARWLPKKLTVLDQSLAKIENGESLSLLWIPAPGPGPAFARLPWSHSFPSKLTDLFDQTPLANWTTRTNETSLVQPTDPGS